VAAEGHEPRVTAVPALVGDAATLVPRAPEHGQHGRELVVGHLAPVGEDVPVEGVVVGEDGIDATRGAVRDRRRPVPHAGDDVLRDFSAIFLNQHVVHGDAHPVGL
jgi:hypothetical protein